MKMLEIDLPVPDHTTLALQFLNLALRNVSTTLRQPAFEFKLGFSAFGLAG